ncbi:MAG: hypothetical protein ACLGIJ_10635 [Candidatus Limnocylindria bacterium]
MSSIERDVLDRLERAGVRYYITGSEALSVWAEPRQTLDIDIVTDLSIADYEAVIRPAFEGAYLVSDLTVVDGRGYGSVIHRTEIRKADLITRPDDPWGRAAFQRRRRMDDAVLGSAWFIAPEDLILAKLAWSGGGTSERQVRDAASVVRVTRDLDWAHIDLYAASLGVAELVERFRDDR